MTTAERERRARAYARQHHVPLAEALDIFAEDAPTPPPPEPTPAQLASRARAAVAKALVTGVLTKARCAHCASIERIEAHHANYEEPLNVVWLCRRCHARHHSWSRRIPRARRRLNILPTGCTGLDATPEQTISNNSEGHCR